MQTVRLSDNKEGIVAAARILRDGGVVAIPTETVYGLAASAYNDNAIAKVFSAKGRPQDNPLIVHISSLDMLNEVAVEIPKEAEKLAEAFWPGPLTLVLKKSENVAQSVSKGLSTVAVRMPEDKVAREIIKQSCLPLAAPSANISGSPSPTTAEHVLADLDGRIDAVVMSGSSNVGLESTVVTLSVSPPTLLRPGAVTVEQLKKFLPDLVIDKAVLCEPLKDEQVASPGMKYKHYSPKTELFLVEAGSEAFVEFVNGKTDCAAICFDEDLDKIKTKALCYGSVSDPKTQASKLFSLLRKTDTLGVSKVYVHAPEKSGIGLAVYNRLIRAAAFKVITL
ncbi:MAG: threonylcarbamoyl-AMP synthase [Ruminococcaceae bacterium]|nr:threonylcarbamoyl-AMP synthase [Oscillospiraceae bacterium]